MKNKTNQDLVKMSHIIVIQMLKKAIDGEVYVYETLEIKTIEELEALRDKLVINYNDVIEARKFAADMIYK